MQRDFTGNFPPGKAPRFDDQEYPAPPALKAYLARLTAALSVEPQRRNLRRWVYVQEGRDHYHYDKVIVSLDLKTYEVRCESDDETHQPTEEEIEAIKAEKYEGWPHAINATDAGAEQLRKMLRKNNEDPTLFVFHNQQKEVPFVQHRIYNVDGMEKVDLPWTLWSDCQWRMMEPDHDADLLPLFGLERLANAAMIILHEGAKTAQEVQRMIDSGEWQQHPWGQNLRFGCHLGWPGGAPNPHRVDWSPILRLPPHILVFICCNNDVSGVNAAPKISQLLLRPLRAIRFGEMFPPHFDLADPFPPEMWKTISRDRSVYKGPSFHDCLFPATWATEVKGKGKSKHIALRAAFAAEWYHSV